MADRKYKEALDEAREDLARHLDARANLDKKIAQLRQTVGVLAQLCGEEVEQKKGLDLFEMHLRDSVIEVFKAYDKPMKPKEIQDGLKGRGHDTKGYGNFMATLHKILQRLELGGVIEHEGEGRAKSYRLKDENVVS
jgi:regulator of replication initiation timing